MEKRLLGILLSVCMVLSLLPTTALAAGRISGSIAESATWSDRDVISDQVTVIGGTREAPVVITVNGTVTANASIIVSRGYVRLTGSGTLQRGDSFTDYMISISDGADLTMDGITISGTVTGTYSALKVYGSFTMNGGSIQDNTATSNGGGVFLNGGTFIMNSGSIQDNTATSNGGGVFLDEGAFLMNGGSISGNRADSAGGVFMQKGDFTMNGGSITGNTANRGGAMIVNSSIKVSGSACITDNTAGTEGSKSPSNVRLAPPGVIIITGALTGSINVSINTAATAASPTEVAVGDGSYVPTSEDASHIFPDAAYSGNSASGHVTYGATMENGKIQLVATKASNIKIVESTGGDYPTLAAAITALNSDTNGGWLIDVQEGQTISAEVKIEKPATITSTNGSMIKRDGSYENSMIRISSLVTLKNITIDGNGANVTVPFPAVVVGKVPSTLTLETGAVVRNNKSDGISGGGVDVVGTLIMNGGSISGNTAYAPGNRMGGGVHLAGTLIMNGGSISGNTANLYGGVEFLGVSQFTMNSGSITGNTTSTGTGGGIGGMGTFTMNGGSITGNTAKKGSGGVASPYAMTVSGSATITDNTAGEEGSKTTSNLYLYDYPLTVVAPFTGSIGVHSSAAATYPANITGANSADYSGNFFPDNTSCVVKNSGSGSNQVVQLMPKDTTINISNIAGVTAPVGGAAPVTAITECDQYTGSVTWSGSPTIFEYATAYTATITITPKAGYTLMGVAENSFQVPGATATNDAGSGVITAVFPKTAAQEQSATPQAEADTVAKAAKTDSSVVFSLTSMPEGTYKAYTTGDGATAADNVAFDAASKTVTVSGAPAVSPQTVYISFTEAGKAESNRLALTVAAAPRYEVTLGANGITDNGVTATAALTSPTSPVETGDTVTVTITLTGTPTASGTQDVNLADMNLAAQTLDVKKGLAIGAGTTKTFTFTMPGEAVTPDVTNVYSPLPSVTNTFKTHSATVTYIGGTMDVSTLFELDANAGAATYSMTPGSGTGMLSTNALTITKAGTFTISVETAETATHAAGAASGTLTVNKGAAPTFDETLSPVPATTRGGEDGKITGLSTGKTYEYKPESAENYSKLAPASTEITGLGKGSYAVRYQETDLYEAGVDVPVFVGQPVGITTAALPGGTVGAAYSQTLAAEDGAAPYTWTVESGNLPAGLTLANNVISGTPATAATADFTVQVTDNGSVTDSKALSITIDAPSSGGGSPPSYSVTNNAAGTENGNVGLSEANAYPGHTVKLTPKADEGYELDTLTAKDSKGDAIKITKNRDGTYSFQMPADNVTVEATFKLTKPWVNPFSDVKESHWFYGAVEYVNKNRLFEGTGTSTFSPGAPMTRAMLWTVVGRLDGQPLSGSGVFDAARDWATAEGITDGTNPGGNITRQQLATTLWRYAGSPTAAADLSKFSDADTVSGYAKDAMAWAVENGLIQGIADKLLPAGNATRAQAAAILMRHNENIVQ